VAEEGMDTTRDNAITIRVARRDDLAALLALVRGLIEHQGDSLEHFDAAALERDVFSDNAAVRALVAERGGALVGYAFFHDCYESAYVQRGVYLSDLFVVPEARRSGAGRALVAGVAAAAKESGRSFVGWVAKEWNVDARAFYEALGAVCEPVTAHAAIFDGFEALAGEGAGNARGKPTKT